MLASTMQFSTNNPITPPPDPPKRTGQPSRACPEKQPETTKPHPPQATNTTNPGQPATPHKKKNPSQGTTNHPTSDTSHHEKMRPCYLRTQQCAKRSTRYHPPPMLSRTPEPPTTEAIEDPEERTHQTAGTTRHLFIDIPPMSTHRGTNARAMG